MKKSIIILMIFLILFSSSIYLYYSNKSLTVYKKNEYRYTQPKKG